MKTTILIFAVGLQRLRRAMPVIAAALLLFATPAFAQAHSDQKQEATPAGKASPSKPGAEQAYLAKRAGEYTRSVKFVGQPDADATASTGTAKISVILDGRFVQEENNDTVFGRPVSGMRLYGYNNITKQYEAIWTYTMSTAILMLTGTSNDAGKTIDYAGTSEASDGSKIQLHARVRQVSDDQFVVTLSSAGPDGKEAAFQETTYTRKK
jgi:uncharacterized protein YdeI (BOF family)